MHEEEEARTSKQQETHALGEGSSVFSLSKPLAPRPQLNELDEQNTHAEPCKFRAASVPRNDNIEPWSTVQIRKTAASPLQRKLTVPPLLGILLAGRNCGLPRWLSAIAKSRDRISTLTAEALKTVRGVSQEDRAGAQTGASSKFTLARRRPAVILDRGLFVSARGCRES
jgi:hypothetical protein